MTTCAELLGITLGATWMRLDRALAKARGEAPIRARAACGTYGGYVRHIRRKEPRCPPCMDAANVYKRSLRERDTQTVQ